MSLVRQSIRGARAGFTLIEVTVVGLILVLLFSIVVSSWESLLPNQELNTALRNLSEALPRAADDVEAWLAAQREAGPRLPA